MQIRAKNFIKISLLVLEKACVICYNILNNSKVKKECGKGLDNDDEECDNPVSQSVSQSSIISLDAFVNTLFVKIANIFSGALRPFNAGSSRLFCALLGEARAGPALSANQRLNHG